MIHWNKTFQKIPKTEFFTGTIDTDGTSVCYHISKPMGEKQADKETVDQCSPLTGRVIAVDPGRVNILFAVEVLEDGTIVTYRLTRSQYYTESGVFEARKHTIQWSKSIQKELQLLSNVSSKKPSVAGFLEYLNVHLGVEDALWNEYTKKRWARQRFALYGGKQRSFAKFCNKLQGKNREDPVIAFGSAKFSSGGKGELSVPTTRAYKEISYRFSTRPTCEFRSSRVSWKDETILDAVGVSGTNVPVRGLLWCRSTNGNKFVNRDLNAAMNIRRCAMAEERPSILDRKKANEPLPRQRIHKWICK